MDDEKAHNTPFVIFLLLFFGMWILRATVFYSIDLQFEPTVERRIYSELLKIIFWSLPVILFLKFANGGDPWTKLKLTTKPNIKGLLLGIAAAIAYFALTIGFELYAHDKSLDLNFTAADILRLLGSVSISPVSEEIMFRGFILQKFSGMTSFGKANVLTSILFVAIHLPNWLWVNGFQLWIPLVSAGIFILSLVLGWMVKKSDSLYPAIAAHIVNNFIAALLK